MHAAIAIPGNSRTILTHVFGRGLEDDRYVVEGFQAMANGDIRRQPGDEPAQKGRRKARRTIASLKAVQQMRPERNEIIICTGLRIRGDVQYWGGSRRDFSATASRSAERRPHGTSSRAQALCRAAGSRTLHPMRGTDLRRRRALRPVRRAGDLPQIAGAEERRRPPALSPPSRAGTVHRLRTAVAGSRAPTDRMSARTTSAGCRSIRRATPWWRSTPAKTTAPGTVGRRSPCASPSRGCRSTRWRCWSTSRRCKHSRRGERPSPAFSPDSATALRCAVH